MEKKCLVGNFRGIEYLPKIVFCMSPLPLKSMVLHWWGTDTWIAWNNHLNGVIYLEILDVFMFRLIYKDLLSRAILLTVACLTIYSLLFLLLELNLISLFSYKWSSLPLSFEKIIDIMDITLLKVRLVIPVCQIYFRHIFDIVSSFAADILHSHVSVISQRCEKWLLEFKNDDLWYEDMHHNISFWNLPPV